MLKKILAVVFLLFTSNFLLTPRAFAAGEFSSSYDVLYDVDSSGITSVTEQVTLKNLTDNYYASSFGLSIGSTKIFDVSAQDQGGPLDATLSHEGNKSKITVKFSSQIAGKDKEYKWTLKFKSSDFAQAQGKIWQVSVPKISSVQDVNDYSLELAVPLEFGDPTSILPQPTKESESGGKINLFFSKDQLTNSGILANFGTNQLFDFTLNYHLSNSSVLPVEAKLPLPPDTNYQEVMINNISPKPENVVLDPDGNYIAYFKLNRYQSLNAQVNGVAKLYINSRQKITAPLSTEELASYTSAQKYWEKDNPVIQGKLSDIFKGGEPSTVKEKARLINNFVVDTLKYDDGKLTKGDFSRLGGLTALNNPDNALCSEFTDLFITLARAAGIPARELDGYAYTPNTDIRPLSFNGTVLHAWPEYFDPEQGWVMIDPTWQNTTGGVDYFSKFDLNHFVLNLRGLDSTEPTTADQVKVTFSDVQFNAHPDISVFIDSPNQIFSGFPSSAKVYLENKGNSFSPQEVLTLSAGAVDVSGSKTVNIPLIPPFGKLSYSFDLRTRNLFQSYDETIIASIGSAKVQRQVLVRPFFAFKFFPVLIIVITGVMVVVYLGALGLHLRRHRSSSSSKIR